MHRGETVAGRFTILRFVARGGMGEVYEALDQVLQSHVALKTILPEFGADPAMLERFRREVVLAQKVTHPNVCRVHHLDSTQTSAGEALHFLTMEFLEGETLSELLKHQGRMSPAEVMPLLRQVAAGLDAAHAEGVVHRDFKTSNVMLVPRQTGDGSSGEMRAVVTDFGIARALHSEAGVEEQVTGGGLLGTPQYMAPEQVTGGEVGPATDIYALGLVLYEMLTGTMPFVGATPLEVAVKRVNDRPPPPRSVVPELDQRWNAAVLKCLERDPKERFSTAGDVVRFLERPAPLVSRRKILTLGLVGLAVALGAFVVPGLLRKHAERAQATAPAFHPRVPVAVAGFATEGDLGDQKWVPATLAELLRMELEGSETSLRVPSAWRGEWRGEWAISQSSTSSVGLAKKSLGLSDADLASPEARQRLSALLGTQWLVTGTIRRSAQSPGRLEVQMSLHGSEPSPVASPILETFVTDDLLTASSRLGERLRTTLGVSLSGKEAEQLRAARPRSLTAARLYADGLQRLTRNDYLGAQPAFAASTAAERSFHAAHVADAATWLMLGYRRLAGEAAQRARETAAALPEREQQLTEALALLASGDERGSRAIYRKVFETWPDDPELAMKLIEETSTPESGFALLDRWRRASGSRASNLYLQVAEAQLRKRTGDEGEANLLLDQTEQRARAMGARIEQGEILWRRALWKLESDPQKALQALLAAEALFNAIPESETAARVKAAHARFLNVPQAAALATEALSEFRRLGMQEDVADVLLKLRSITHMMGDVRASEHWLSEFRDQMRSMDAPEGLRYFEEKAWLAWIKGEIRKARQAIIDARRTQQYEGSGEEFQYGLESAILREEDRLAEARAVLERGRRIDLSWGEEHLGADPLRVACRLECDSQKYKEGLACLDEVLRPTKPGKVPERGPLPELAVIGEGECRLAMGDAAGALVALEQVNFKAPQTAARRDVLRARADAQQGRSPAAIAQLRKTLTDSEQRLWGIVALEAKLALGEVELRAGRAQGRPRLMKLEEEARSKGFLRIARLAREALDSQGKRPPAH